MRHVHVFERGIPVAIAEPFCELFFFFFLGTMQHITPRNSHEIEWSALSDPCWLERASWISILHACNSQGVGGMKSRASCSDEGPSLLPSEKRTYHRLPSCYLSWGSDLSISHGFLVAHAGSGNERVLPTPLGMLNLLHITSHSASRCENARGEAGRLKAGNVNFYIIKDGSSLAPLQTGSTQ